MRIRSRWSWIASVASLLCYTSAFAAESADISNVAGKVGIAALGDTYEIGGKLLLCIQTATHGQSLWDPTLLDAAPGADSNCPKAPLAWTFIPDAPPRGRNPLPPLPNQRTSFSGAASIFSINTSTGHCGPNLLPTYYTVTFPDGQKSSFYVVSRLKQPRKLVLPEQCAEEVGQPLSIQVDFDALGSLHSIALTPESTLLYGGSAADVEPAVLAVRRLPTNLWTADRNVYFVPVDLIGPLLKEAGLNPSRRYQALLQVIGESPTR